MEILFRCLLFLYLMVLFFSPWIGRYVIIFCSIHFSFKFYKRQKKKVNGKAGKVKKQGPPIISWKSAEWGNSLWVSLIRNSRQLSLILLLNSLYLLPNLLRKEKTEKAKQEQPGPIMLLKMLSTFLLITFTWIFFRSANVEQAFHYIGHLFSRSLFQYPQMHGMALALPLIFILFAVESSRKYGIRLAQPQNASPYLRWTMYLILAVTCLAFYKQDQTFIYFQFWCAAFLLK